MPRASHWVTASATPSVTGSVSQTGTPALLPTSETSAAVTTLSPTSRPIFSLIEPTPSSGRRGLIAPALSGGRSGDGALMPSDGRPGDGVFVPSDGRPGLFGPAPSDGRPGGGARMPAPRRR